MFVQRFPAGGLGLFTWFAPALFWLGAVAVRRDIGGIHAWSALVLDRSAGQPLALRPFRRPGLAGSGRSTGSNTLSSRVRRLGTGTHWPYGTLAGLRAGSPCRGAVLDTRSLGATLGDGFNLRAVE